MYEIKYINNNVDIYSENVVIVGNVSGIKDSWLAYSDIENRIGDISEWIDLK